jgi:ribosomal protein L40E
MSACPKCGADVVESASACKKCGLAVDRMQSFASSREADVPEVLVAAWHAAVEHWDDDARHEEVLRLVTANDAYSWAASKYRGKAGDPIADRYLDRVRKSAEATMMTSATARNAEIKNPYKNTIAMLVILAVAILGGLLYAFVKSSKAEPTPPTIPAEVK